MTEELKKKLMSHHTEEMNDITSYETLSKEAWNSGEHETAGILKDIAYEERTHADMLKHILDMHEN